MWLEITTFVPRPCDWLNMKHFRFINRLFACILIAVSCASCITTSIISNQRRRTNNIDKKSVRLSGKTVQLINRHGALVVTDRNDIVCIISDFDDYYDGMAIKGQFHRYGTYEYLFSDGTIHYAPIFVKEKDYRKYKIIAEELGAARLQTGEKKKVERRSDI